MRVRDAVEGDGETLARVAGLPANAARGLIHDRTVRVADDDGDVIGFVVFDAYPGVVHVTWLCGDGDAVTRLLEEPVGFAAGEGMAVEAVLPESADGAVTAVEKFGFESEGAGPQFDGEPTRRFRLDPA